MFTKKRLTGSQLHTRGLESIKGIYADFTASRDEIKKEGIAIEDARAETLRIREIQDKEYLSESTKNTVSLSLVQDDIRGIESSFPSLKVGK